MIYELACPEHLVNEGLFLIKSYLTSNKEYAINVKAPCGFLFLRRRNWFIGYNKELGFFAEYIGEEK